MLLRKLRPPSRRDRTIFYAVEIEGWPAERVGRVFGLKAKTVRVICGKVRRTLAAYEAWQYLADLWEETPRG